MIDNNLTSRAVRSFVIRNGRLTDGQKKALDALYPAYGLKYRAEPVNLAEIYGNDHPVWLEIGFGDGESMLEMANARPETNFLGIEVHAPGVGHLLHQVRLHGLENIRVIRHDAIEVLENMIAPDTLDRVLVLFPDPWPKKRHHKRRIVQPEIVALIEAALAPGGRLHCATDWAEYATHMLEVLENREKLGNCADQASEGYCLRPGYRPLTKFEKRGLRLGHEVADLLFEKLP